MKNILLGLLSSSLLLIGYTTINLHKENKRIIKNQQILNQNQNKLDSNYVGLCKEVLRHIKLTYKINNKVDSCIIIINNLQ